MLSQAAACSFLFMFATRLATFSILCSLRLFKWFKHFLKKLVDELVRGIFPRLVHFTGKEKMEVILFARNA